MTDFKPKTGRDYLRLQARSNHPVRSQLAQGIFYADESARISGTLSLALRNSSVASGKLLLDWLESCGLTTQAQVSRAMNTYYFTCLNILSPPGTVEWKDCPKI